MVMVPYTRATHVRHDRRGGSPSLYQPCAARVRRAETGWSTAVGVYVARGDRRIRPPGRGRLLRLAGPKVFPRLPARGPSAAAAFHDGPPHVVGVGPHV